MIRIYFVRHGQKQEIWGDPFLTDIGIKQAEITGDFFKDKKISKIYASPLNRTVQTASIIAKSLNLEVKTDKRLVERINWDQEGVSSKDFMKEWAKTDEDRKYNPRFGKSAFLSGKNMESFVDEISNNTKDMNILIVSHGGIIGDFLRNVFSDKNLPLTNVWWTKAKFLELWECSITIIEKVDNSYRLLEVGSIEHLPHEFRTTFE
jgi:broad specificity phosphatase PhoE